LNIEDWRDEIDRLDEQLVKLLNARSQCAIAGRIKRELGLAVYSPIVRGGHRSLRNHPGRWIATLFADCSRESSTNPGA